MEPLPSIVFKTLQKGERLLGWHTSGGGYGNPHDRDVELVLKDVLEGYETIERARDIYGVVLTGLVRDETIAIDYKATSALRGAN